MIVEERWIETERGRLYGRKSTPAGASKAPLVLLHDSLGCVDLWGSLPTQLSEATSRPVIAYDRLGYGRSDARSDRPKRDFIREEAEDFFPHVRRAFALERYALFGHSVGGGMSVTIGALRPNEVVAVVSESAQALVEAKTIEAIRAARRAFEDPARLARLTAVHGQKAEAVVDTWSEAWLNLQRTPWSLTASLPRIQCPLLIIHGDEDEFGSNANPEGLKDWAGAQARIEIFEKTKHIPHRENRDRVIAITNDFLKNLE